MSGHKTKAYGRLVQMGVRATEDFNVAKGKYMRATAECRGEALPLFTSMKEKGNYINTLGEVAEQVFERKVDLYMGDLHAAIHKA